MYLPQGGALGTSVVLPVWCQLGMMAGLGNVAGAAIGGVKEPSTS